MASFSPNRRECWQPCERWQRLLDGRYGVRLQRHYHQCRSALWWRGNYVEHDVERDQQGTLAGGGGLTVAASIFANNLSATMSSMTLLFVTTTGTVEHVRQNGDGGVLQSTSALSNIGAGAYATTLNPGGFTVVNQGAPHAWDATP